MANFDSSLSSPYQQLVPSQHWTPTINQLWGAPVNSLGYHPYESSMYSRATNYKKFGFSHFYTLTGPDVIKYQDKIDESPYVSDSLADSHGRWMGCGALHRRMEAGCSFRGRRRGGHDS